MIVVMFVRGRFGAALAIHPARIPVDVGFLLPDRQTVFDLVDDEAAGAKSLVAMRSARAHPYGDIADREGADAVHAGGARHAELLDGGLDDTRAFLLGQFRECLVFQPRDGVAFIVITHPAFERCEPAATLVAYVSLQGGGVQRRGAEAEGRVHPPATGGMKTTASPVFSGCDQSPNSALMATRSISAGKVKG
jgi:hypothetical protein